MAHRKSTALQLAAFLLLGASSALAQQSPGLAQPPFGQRPDQSQITPDSSTPTLKVQTRLTVEDVTVTDAKDKPVHGLTQPDFTVKEDGKVQTIKNFEEYGSEQPQAQVAPPKLPPDTYTNRQAATPSAVNILLLDNVSTGLGGQLLYRPQSMADEKLQAIKYLKAMPEGTQVAILKLTDGLRVIQGFTSDRGVLLAAIDSVKPERANGAYRVGRPPGVSPTAGLGDACAAANRQSEIVTAALAGIADFVSGIKGRKNLIWFTPGIPWLTNYLLFSRAVCLRDYSPQLHNAYGLLRAARVAVYPINPKGLQSCTSLDPADSCTPDTLIQDHLSVQDVANNTGGKAYYNQNDLDAAIGEAIANGSDYYSLSYVPPLSKYDGKYHTIEVKVDRPGLQLHYREGYTSLDLAQPLPPDKKNPAEASAPPISQFHAAMAHGKPDVTELLFDVTVLPSTAPAKPGDPAAGTLNPKLKGKPLVRYDFDYLLPAGAITLAGDDPSGTRTGSVEVVIAAYSADGDLLNSTNMTTTLTVKADQVAQFLQQSPRLHAQLDLPPGKVFVRIGILDVASQKMGILEIPEAFVVK